MTTPKDAASLVLLRNPEDPHIYWVKRADSLMYMGGFHVYPGGQRDAEDGEIPVANAESTDSAAMMACALRETFEETGVLIAHGVEKLTPAELQALRSDLMSNTRSFKAILMSQGLTLDAELLVPGGRWVTPPFAPRRFDTWFFTGWLPENQEASIVSGELVYGEWIRPQEALTRWQKGEVMMAPPTLHIIRTLAGGLTDLHVRLTAIAEANRGLVKRIEMRPGILLFPVRTPTLPPATHTNCYIVGGSEIVIIDPASPYEEEQLLLAEFIDNLMASGVKPREIILTHYHPDHIGGVEALRQHLKIPVAASALTRTRVAEQFPVDRVINDNDLIELAGEPGWRLRALHTPGHTRDHLCFFEENTGALISGDLIVGFGTVVIDPPEGDMEQYLTSLRRVAELGLTAIFGAHGPPIGGAQAKVSQYIAHRLEREANIIKALEQGISQIPDIVKVVYTDVPAKMHKLAERSVLAHLEKVVREGKVVETDGQYQISR